MNLKRIAILGGGNGGHQMAIDLTIRGFEIILYEHPDYAESFKNTLETQVIESTGLLQKKTKIFKATTDITEALREVDIIYLVVPALAHEAYYNLMIPNLRNGQVVIVWAGDAGSLRLAKRLKDEAPEKEIIIGETNTIPYGTRLVAPSKVDLFVTSKGFLVAGFPAIYNDKVFEIVRKTFPVVKQADNVLSISFSNPNPTVHPPGTILNIGRIQYSKGDFYLYKEGITEAPARMIKTVYDETLAVATAFGFNMREFEDDQFRNRCSVMCVDFWAPFDKGGIVMNIKGPTHIHNRYITEDLPYGLVQRSQLGELVGIKTPIIDSIINLGGAICEINAWEGRTLEDLGLAGMSKDEIMNYLAK